MQTLFLEKTGITLRTERACLLIYQQGKHIGSLPLKELERVVASPQVVLAAGVLGVFCEHNIALLVVNHSNPKRTAYLSAPMHSDVHRRMRQYALYQDQTFRTHQARRLVFLKLSRQYRLLAKQQDSRPDLRHVLFKAMETLRHLLEDIKTDGETLTLERLRGVEGAAGGAYFAAYSRLFPPALGFEHRHRRPPTDPVNACLSLSYTLLHHEAADALRAVGLDPALGCYHDLYYQRDSLACDLLEPIRPWIDAWVFGLFHSHRLRPEDFKHENGGCLLQAAGKQRFYETYRRQAPAFRRLLRQYARMAEHTVMNDESQ
ncbi:CRISPR-associated endonuclease Cas1 [Methylomarinum sp. Ch1-1]|uniref:CRISPR-associated endonuclease Cas1 n=1 Tax=Methylomarinum roseum TaxID=3067653 RepID=A0AAU7NZK9_9GAMM|nr:CRISPR-associated endonuclease Cas1 [Methylomarinum sp. Ch1-1]MDP4521419.1 CRISPR-associated endonuclease Cas1 [Methylomarinum sp. Ch1-1]